MEILIVTVTTILIQKNHQVCKNELIFGLFFHKKEHHI